jgi:hypothetical protein
MTRGNAAKVRGAADRFVLGLGHQAEKDPA